MKSLAVLVFVGLVLAPGASNAAMSRGEHMKACAAEWKAKGHHSHGGRYQHFMRECLKKMASSG